ncbi:phosphoribosylanthranilate isomerase [Magnetospirillum moscoviense]|uniref:N-(5'-phosphoribosyl)anthranilate isomerase n=1 Tax=Magnetospirillum moscoviense TaxID=1437059 RepID=A0A178MYX8_9PROT|nr:phosphoribosylanthranilate isomerase [Magnetospirillum moscoviense]MBF0326564.1 phosphoribosylanthranilate isomerase [Alphaproteobacteria bacterium]OAN55148.1 N-(5'-phosphoribosyl)anthranilate isomerase [Magnetospirillum moscoviense]
MSAEVKICGLTDADTVDAALEAGADYLGLVFFAQSPRAIEPDAAAEILQFADDVIKVGLFVDADDAALDRVLSTVRLDLLQFHGNESPERIEQVRLDFGLPVMKVIPVSGAADLERAELFVPVADRLLFDAKPPKGSDLPGGNAVSFDWTILQGFKCRLPWMLAGGLTPANVAQAIRISGATAVDVSSGVESAPGTKDSDLIRAFIRAAKAS